MELPFASPLLSCNPASALRIFSFFREAPPPLRQQRASARERFLKGGHDSFSENPSRKRGEFAQAAHTHLLILEAESFVIKCPRLKSITLLVGGCFLFK